MADDLHTAQTPPPQPAASPIAKAARPSPQPEWRLGLSDAQWEALRDTRDASINGYLKAALEAHRASGKPWEHAMRTSPLDRAAVVRDGYSATRVHPVDGDVRGHFALDIAPVGGGEANVVAMLPGTVLYVGNFSANAGYSVMVLNDNGEIDFYAHMKAGSMMHLHPGARVRQGQILGDMGQTGKATGPHVHITTRALNEQARQQSARAQTETLDFSGLMVQPIGVERTADPALDWTKYENMHPTINGEQYRVNARIPAPPNAVLRAGNPLPRMEDFFPELFVPKVEPTVTPIPVAPVESVPTSSNLPSSVGSAEAPRNEPLLPRR